MKLTTPLFLSFVIVLFFSCTEVDKTNSSVFENLAIIREPAPTAQMNQTNPTPTIIDSYSTVTRQSGQPSLTDPTPLSSTILSLDSIKNLKLSMVEILELNGKKASVRNIDNTISQTVSFKEGTKLIIPANSFETMGGNPVVGQVELAVKEYYNKNDFLIENLSTMSNGRILESGGTIHISAFANGNPCKLKKDKRIEILFPTEKKKRDMTTFYGEKLNDEINWIPTNTTNVETISKKQIINPVYNSNISWSPTMRFPKFWELPHYPGGRKAFNKLIRRKAKLKKGILEKNKIERIYVNFDIDDKGGIANIAAEQNDRKNLETECLRLTRLMPNLVFGDKRQNPRANKYKGRATYQISHTGKIICLNLNTREATGTRPPVVLDKFYAQKLDSATSTSQITTADILNYSLYTNQLGWINCDRFYRDQRAKTFLAVNKKPKEDIIIKLVFEDIRSIINGYQSDKQFVFKNIPVNEKVTVFAIKKVNSKIFLASKKVITNLQKQVNLNFKQVAQSELKNEIQNLAL